MQRESHKAGKQRRGSGALMEEQGWRRERKTRGQAGGGKARGKEGGEEQRRPRGGSMEEQRSNNRKQTSSALPPPSSQTTRQNFRMHLCAKLPRTKNCSPQRHSSECAHAHNPTWALPPRRKATCQLDRICQGALPRVISSGSDSPAKNNKI